MPRNPRDYKLEYEDNHSSPKQKKDRAARNKARNDSSLKKGDPREIDHIKPLSKGGSTDKSNTRITTREKNRKKKDKM